MKKATRLVSLLLCMVMLFSVTSAFAVEFNEPGTFPIAKETVHFTIGIPKSTTVLDWDTNFMTTSLMEDMNCTFEFIEMGADNNEMKQKVDLLINAGEELPDILIYNPGAASASYYGSLGVFRSLNEYLDDAYYLPKALESIPYDAYTYARSADGNLYGLFTIEYAMETAIYIRLYTNMTFVEQLGLELPTSLQEFEDLLRAIKTGDPNGNGLNDEIPFLTSKTRLWNHFVMPLMTPFVYSVGQDGNNYLSFDENGKLQASYATEGWKEGLTWLRKLVKEELISPLCFTLNDDEVKAFANSGANGEEMIGVSTYYPVNWYPTGDERAVNWACMRCLEGFDGVRTAPMSIRTPTLNYVITESCDEPEAAFKLGDLMSCEYIGITQRWGEMGKDWDYTDVAKDVQNWEAPYENFDLYMIAYDDNSFWRGTEPQDACWIQAGVLVRHYAIANGVGVPAGSVSPYTQHVNESNSLYQEGGYAPDEFLTVLNYTEDEAVVIGETQSALKSYIAEYIGAVMMGTKNLEGDWDTFQTELEKIGLSDYLAAVQSAYDRMYK